MTERTCDILIVGGGVGGTAAALAASTYGFDVVLAEEYAWIGGQLTSQGVPPDENPWIERGGATATYRDYRSRVRDYYRTHYPVKQEIRDSAFNPGGGFVSGLCHEPRIAHAVLLDMLAAPLVSKKLIIKTGVVPIAADVDSDTVRAVHVRNLTSGEIEIITAKVVIDCTELGDLLPLTGTEYVSGAEARSETGELHGADIADPNDVQGFTWCFAAGYDARVGASHVIEKPDAYDTWRSFVPDLTDSQWPGNLLDWTAVDPISLRPRKFDLFVQEGRPYNSLWNYRKIVSSENLAVAVDDVTLVNWPQNDYFIQNIIDQPDDIVSKALEASRELSLSLLYWMQTEAPRPDGGAGYPGLYPSGAVLGTENGLAMAPYIRESRRIKALFTVTEAHVGYEMRHAAGFSSAQQFEDTVGIGSYRIDLHPTPAQRNYVDISCLPFQIPLGALIPVRTRNLIAGNKNLGVTHITNGCYRLHPVEWNIGESAGHLAAFCLKNKRDPKAVHETPTLRQNFQTNLTQSGIELSWPPEIAETPR